MYHENATHVLHDATAVHVGKAADLCVSEFEVHVARVDRDDVLCDQLAMEKDGGASPHQIEDSVDLPDELK
ncbi:hypothetical protein FQA47_019911 [Oryzias melastigma]|uniref:Uncharacterized protein n=1 Tax=Oryzias melastigma TaxID=30732 RepID=A0A834FKA8_ORYME|nr:hypothetical protein FQA47_019911 [Oryzias melastigma]